MMAMKARIMRDEETAKKITQAETPAEAKTLGREVKNFNQQVRRDTRFHTEEIVVTT